jgi:hypothetical protein
MKQFIGIVLFVAILNGLSSCTGTSITKPDKLISKDEFVKIMVDVYLIQGINLEASKPDSLKKIKQTDLYFSVLKKHDIPDTVFIRSLIYYSSFPKDYEKMHTQIMNVLKEKEEQFKPKDKLNVKAE